MWLGFIHNCAAWTAWAETSAGASERKGRRVGVAVILLLALVAPAPAADPGPWLVFTRARDIYTISVSTVATQQLTATPQREDQPAWSWDGGRIAYDRGGDIWTMQEDGTDQTNETPGTPSKERSPFWFPDGRLGFSSDRSGVEKLYVLDVAGWQPLGRRGRNGAVSRDGENVCYTRELEVYWAKTESGLEQNVSNSEGSDHGCVWDPTVDDPYFLLVHSHRAYEQAVRKRTGRIWRATRDGVFDSIPLTEGSDNNEGDNWPAWHRSGWVAWSRHIGCTPDKPCSEQRDKMELFARGPLGQVFRLTFNAVEDSQPRFGP